MTPETQKRGILRQIFISNSEPRLRAGWRLLVHTLLLVLLSTVTGMIVFIPIGLFKVSFDSPLAMLANELTMLVAITGATFLTRRFLDRRSIVSLGLKLNAKALLDVLTGIVITFFQMGLIFGLEVALGWTKFEGFAWQTETASTVASGLAAWLVVFLIVGWQEELLSRGYHLQTLESGFNLFWGVLISSSIFGVLHIFNPSANWLSTLGIVLAGLFLALPYLLTRQLWLSIGLHIGWNFFEGVVFGFPVSGTDSFHLLRHTVSGPVLWTGGAFGPEAGLLVIPALIFGSLLVFAYTRLKIQKTNVDS
ncbi:MAG: type II CAAX endopeptidase family protein [Chloroflexi bacterium]|nr:type II CAAX endopeptidase family protein [Chloroflexota bacterium]